MLNFIQIDNFPAPAQKTSLPIDLFIEITSDLQKNHHIEYLPMGKTIFLSKNIIEGANISGLVGNNLCYAFVAPYQIVKVKIKDNLEVFYSTDYNHQPIHATNPQVLSKKQVKLKTNYPQLQNQVLDWLCGEDTGLSSLFIAKTLFSDDILAEPAYPHDIGDFGRCFRFLQLLPELKKDLPKLATTSEPWQKLVDNWETLENLYLEEFSSMKFNKTSQLLKSLINEKKLSPNNK